MADFLGTGLHQIPAERYHSDPMERPSLSSTLARLMVSQSPLHAFTASQRLNPDWKPTDSKIFDFGRAAHRAILGAGGDYTVIPEEVLGSGGAASTKEAKAFIAEAREAGLTPIKAADAEQVEMMAAKCRACLAEMKIEIDPAYSEVAALAEIEGVSVRALIDNAPAGKPWLLDMKTTVDASPDACVRSVVNYSYDVQVAHYLDTWRAATGESRRFLLAFQEKTPPYEVGVVELDTRGEAEWMTSAFDKAKEARRLWDECLITGTWPGYPRMIATVGAPLYHTAKWEGRAKPPAPSASTLHRAADWQRPQQGDAA
jgi:hypothetical protein